ncbi:MAG: DUF3667 domain-containing protein, partial [Gammaproteobacteria bacterium]|nr:DUF3667 domain-containing protein [Gammaproteobacteria bacterium]
LSGRYCSSCGQRADTQAHTLGHFLGEATEVLTHADSRVWGTLWPLLAQPGFLTREYFAGRRARYLQPFRLYLIMSVLFFVLSAVLGGGQASNSSSAAAAQPSGPQDCADVTTNLHWGHYQLLPQLQKACRNIRADSGRQFSERVVHNIGRALFAFLLLSIYTLATHWIRSNSLLDVLFLIASWYLVRYLYRSMKLFYGQSRRLTLLKFALVGCAYLVCGVITLFATALYSAATL